MSHSESSHVAQATPASDTQGTPWGAYSCLFLSMFMVGSYVALSKPLLQVLSPNALALLRFAFAALVMLPWLLRVDAQEPSVFKPLNGRLLALFALQALIGSVLFTACMLAGVARTTATNAGVIMSAIPAAVAVLSWLVLRERVSGRAWGAVVLAVVAVASLNIVRSSGDHGGAQQITGQALLGNLFVVAAVLCEASYVVIGKRLTGLHISPMRIAALINLCSLVWMLPTGIPAVLATDFAKLTLQHWLLFVYYAIAASAITVWLWMLGLKRVPASRAGVFCIGLPIGAATIGILFLGESLTGVHVFALLCGMGCIYLATSGSQTQTETNSGKST